MQWPSFCHYRLSFYQGNARVEMLFSCFNFLAFHNEWVLLKVTSSSCRYLWILFFSSLKSLLSSFASFNRVFDKGNLVFCHNFHNFFFRDFFYYFLRNWESNFPFFADGCGSPGGFLDTWVKIFRSICDILVGLKPHVIVNEVIEKSMKMSLVLLLWRVQLLAFRTTSLLSVTKTGVRSEDSSKQVCMQSFWM